jgi:hypothetical protein
MAKIKNVKEMVESSAKKRFKNVSICGSGRKTVETTIDGLTTPEMPVEYSGVKP